MYASLIKAIGLALAVRHTDAHIAGSTAHEGSTAPTHQTSLPDSVLVGADFDLKLTGVVGLSPDTRLRLFPQTEDTPHTCGQPGRELGGPMLVTSGESSSHPGLQWDMMAPPTDGTSEQLFASQPKMVQKVQPDESIMLVFSEVVQSGTGVIEVVDEQDDRVKFTVDAASFVLGESVPGAWASGHNVFITPKALCHSEHCGDLMPGHHYYVRARTAGVVIGRGGALSPPFNTKNIWTIIIRFALNI